jgi:Sec-independent protein translocase protein TatA
MAYTVKAGSHDMLRINIHDDYEVRYWTRRLGVTSETLKAAVSKIGPMVKDLESELKRARSERSEQDREQSEQKQELNTARRQQIHACTSRE